MQKKVNTDRAFSYYPSPEEVDQWAGELLQRSKSISVHGEFLDVQPVRIEFGNGPNTLQNQFVRFTTDSGHCFWGYWQPSFRTPAPLLINLPGYGGYMNLHPQLCDEGYHILHISPLGYVTPEGAAGIPALEDGQWPVLHNTAMGLSQGYDDWLLDCLCAIEWARRLPGILENRVSLYGTSQGGGGSLLLASILGKDIRCVCADLPFLTNFPLSHLEGDAYGILKTAYSQVPEEIFWRRLGFIDTLSHAHRITAPVMLSGGGKDNTCPAPCIESLFSRLNVSKQFTYLKNGIHTHSRASMFLFRSWLGLYA